MSTTHKRVLTQGFLKSGSRPQVGSRGPDGGVAKIFWILSLATIQIVYLGCRPLCPLSQTSPQSIQWSVALTHRNANVSGFVYMKPSPGCRLLASVGFYSSKMRIATELSASFTQAPILTPHTEREVLSCPPHKDALNECSCLALLMKR